MGQYVDAYAFTEDLVKRARRQVILIDNHLDESMLLLPGKRKTMVQTCIYTSRLNGKFRLDMERHNARYPPVGIRRVSRIHDRFLIIDHEVYHIGASLKDLGKKLFAFSKMQLPAEELLGRLAATRERILSPKV